MIMRLFEVHILALNNKRAANIIFGKFDENGVGIITATKSKQPIKVFSVIVNGVYDLIQKLKIETVIFSAKNNDDSFASRSSLYSALGTSISKKFGWNVYVKEGRKLSVTILSKQSLSSEDLKLIKQNVQDEKCKLKNKP